jgi:hypothetical protein
LKGNLWLWLQKCNRPALQVVDIALDDFFKVDSNKLSRLLQLNVSVHHRPTHLRLVFIILGLL